MGDGFILITGDIHFYPISECSLTFLIIASVFNMDLSGAMYTDRIRIRITRGLNRMLSKKE